MGELVLSIPGQQRATDAVQLRGFLKFLYLLQNPVSKNYISHNHCFVILLVMTMAKMALFS